MHWTWKRRKDDGNKQANDGSDRESMLPVKEAAVQTQRAVEYLEKAINMVDGTPWRKGRAREEKLSLVFMSLLAEEHGGISPPPDVPIDKNDK